MRAGEGVAADKAGPCGRYSVDDVPAPPLDVPVLPEAPGPLPELAPGAVLGLLRPLPGTGATVPDAAGAVLVPE